MTLGNKSNWAVSGTGERYGAGEIFAFQSLKDALNWAQKMDWSQNEEWGSGKISIIKINPGEGWDIDESDPLGQAGFEGDWLKRVEPIDASLIGDSIVFEGAEDLKWVPEAPAGPQEGPSTLDSTPTWNLPEIEVDTGDLLPHITVDGDKITFIDREGNRRDIDEFATEASQRSSKKSNVDDWLNLPAADTEIDIDRILTLAPGLEYLGIQTDKGPDVHGFKAAHGEILYMRAVKFIPKRKKSAGYSEEHNRASEEFFKKTGVSTTAGIHLSFPGQKKSHAILMSDFGLAFPNEEDGGAELEEIIHWAQTSGRWSPEINDFLQKEFSEQALVAGKDQADVIEDTAKGLAVAITKALKHRDPVAVGKLRKRTD